MYVLIDDQRTLGADIICRSIDGAKLVLQGFKHVKYTLGIDYDLGFEETGHDILKWAIKENILPDFVQLVTMNPVGRKEMAWALMQVGYESYDNINFVKGNNYVDCN
jgi:hypothetical protein